MLGSGCRPLVCRDRTLNFEIGACNPIRCDGMPRSHDRRPRHVTAARYIRGHSPPPAASSTISSPPLNRSQTLPPPWPPPAVRQQMALLYLLLPCAPVLAAHCRPRSPILCSPGTNTHARRPVFLAATPRCCEHRDLHRLWNRGPHRSPHCFPNRMVPGRRPSKQLHRSANEAQRARTAAPGDPGRRRWRRR